jgi:hypothetical protein
LKTYYKKSKKKGAFKLTKEVCSKRIVPNPDIVNSKQNVFRTWINKWEEINVGDGVFVVKKTLENLNETEKNT